MNLPFKIARRYLFAKQSTNAINIITGISVFGIAIQTAAFILILSVFNGFEELLLNMFSNFNPEIKVTLKKGKTFSEDSIALNDLVALEEVEYISKSIEETAIFSYKSNDHFGIIKGVDSLFKEVNSIDSTIIDGRYILDFGNTSFAVIGSIISNELGVDIEDDFTTVSVYMPKERAGPMEQPFRTQFLYPAGIFSFQQDFDSQYIITNLDFCHRLLNKPNELSALELKLKSGVDDIQAQKRIESIIGSKFKVQTRYEQEETFLRLLNIEKWLGFIVLTLTLLLVAFNLIGSLWMIVLEKKKDIAILKSMGSQDNSIRNIFLYEGLLLCGLGLGIGSLLAIIFYLLQKTFGIISMPSGMLIESYPMNIQLFDFVAVMIVVMLIGFLASLPAALRAKRIPAMVREE